MLRALTLAILVLASAIAGCASNTPAPSTTSTPGTTTPLVTAKESFDKSTVGALPTGWSAVVGTWVVTAEATAPSAPNVLRQTDTTKAFPYAVDDAVGSLEDGSVSVKFDVLSGASAQAGGVTFRFVDKDNNYVARANGNEGNFALFHTIGGKREKMMEAEATTGTNTWLSIRAEFHGKEIAVYSGATKLFEVEEDDAMAPTAGKVGVWTKDDSVTMFDDFEAETV
jgi:hypothetical protein